MKVTGQAVLHAPIGRVWAALNDPAVLVRTIPGCERLEATGPDAYAMTVTAGVASIKGTYSGEVKLHDQQPPASFVMSASGAGGPGTVSTEVQVRLEEVDGATRLTYDADAVVGGMIGGVGQRMLAGVAKKTAGEFFAAVDDVLTGKAPALVTAPATAAPAQDGVYLVPPKSARAVPEGFATGAVVGAVIALAGVLVGGLLGRRRS
ncbi:MAG TPA: carbon monoxide dehydrogenase subunit G [Jatrophihabitantaceae bacterium]|nr:carbon monoxide dehydrogenase subunit G [Jatrophihabitantaceae bacterium]